MGNLIQDQFEVLDMPVDSVGGKVDVLGVATFSEVDCECTSDCGEVEVTEQWTEYELVDFEVTQPDTPLSEKILNDIRDLIPPYLP
jgi:hypothetical protein